MKTIIKAVILPSVIILLVGILTIIAVIVDNTPAVITGIFMIYFVFILTLTITTKEYNTLELENELSFLPDGPNSD